MIINRQGLGGYVEQSAPRRRRPLLHEGRPLEGDEDQALPDIHDGEAENDVRDWAQLRQQPHEARDHRP